VAIICALGLLLGRTAWLQVISPEKLVKEEDMRSIREEKIVPPRGMIVDRHGLPLAVSVPVSAIWADPKVINSSGGVSISPRWQARASALHMPLSEIADRIRHNPKSRFIYLARQLDPQQAKWIDNLNLPGINLQDESRRFYPSGHVAANLLGFTNVDGQGIEGIEKSFNAQLTGKPGLRRVRKDRHGHVIENMTETPAVPAHTLMLSIDKRRSAPAL